MISSSLSPLWILQLYDTFNDRGPTPYIQILNFITLAFIYANEQIDGSTWKSIICENQIPEQQTSEILHNGGE
ncbi:unnamed protein product [Adineta steineri]|uniref:Uncharacterized protein n=1 Tax=Adineta steineri TaxID=433720 RepID=A0A819NUV2_9BILA|nr:unnamed protein product [Adineta steineri]CAF0987479.1 unnamed protein product [Adineta steineri]CAF4000475.1 unnamed protein product [Adineta steineri]CAF4179438.1 unnamed protein product [Adineta steineri]